MRKRLLGDPALIYFTDLERFTAALFLFGQLKVDISGRWGQNLKLSWIRFCWKGYGPSVSIPKAGMSPSLCSELKPLCVSERSAVISYSGRDWWGRRTKKGGNKSCVYKLCTEYTASVQPLQLWQILSHFLGSRKTCGLCVFNSECKSCISEGKNALFKIIHQCSVKTLIYSPKWKVF